jgi:putative membrane protein
MIKLIIKWVLFALVIMATCYLPGVKVDGFEYAMLIAFVLALLNVFVKPLLKIIAFPLNVLTFGLFNFSINFVLLMLVAYFIPQYHLDNTFIAVIVSIILAFAFGIIRRI